MSKIANLSEEELASIIADSTEIFINENKLALGSFHWQQSASAYSVSKSEIDRICKYILNQDDHQKKVSFTEEYEIFLKYYQDTLQK